ncbi:MAG: hypothetical protein ACJATF_004113, partial [Flavobacteriales bacterium]
PAYRWLLLHIRRKEYPDLPSLSVSFKIKCKNWLFSL